MMVCSMLSHFSPDVLVMDTVAQGSFQEFNFVKDFAKMGVLIDRHKKDDYNGARIHQAHLPLFDKILVPDDEQYEVDYNYEDSLKNRVHYVGRIHNFDLSEAWSREDVRDYFNVEDGQKLIYLSAGGGGDTEAESQICHLLDALESLDVRVIIGYGALSQSAKVYGRKNIISLTEPGVCQYFKGVDLAISAAGYNTYEELLAAKVRCLFFVQDKGMDLQERRLEQGMENGWHGCIDISQSTEEIRQAVNSSLVNDVPSKLLDRQDSYGDCAAAFELLSSVLAGNVERKLNATMAKSVMRMHSSGSIKTNSIVSCYHVWKMFVYHKEGEDAWQQKCIDASAKSDNEMNLLIVEEFRIISEMEMEMTEAGLTPYHRKEFIKYICKLDECSLANLDAKFVIKEEVKNYLIEKNHVE